MAIQTFNICSFNNGSVRFFCTYDDVSLVIQTVALANDGASGTLSVTVTDPTTHAVVWSGTRQAATGTSSQNVATQNWKMLNNPPVGHYTTNWISLPWNISASWSTA